MTNRMKKRKSDEAIHYRNPDHGLANYAAQRRPNGKRESAKRDALLVELALAGKNF
jgi:hypothetical protein